MFNMPGMILAALIVGVLTGLSFASVAGEFNVAGVASPATCSFADGR